MKKPVKKFAGKIKMRRPVTVVRAMIRSICNGGTVRYNYMYYECKSLQEDLFALGIKLSLLVEEDDV